MSGADNNADKKHNVGESGGANNNFVGTMADKTGVLGFIDALAVFIKQERVKARRVDNVGDKRHKEADLSWAEKYAIQVHGSITT